MEVCRLERVSSVFLQCHLAECIDQGLTACQELRLKLSKICGIEALVLNLLLYKTPEPDPPSCVRSFRRGALVLFVFFLASPELLCIPVCEVGLPNLRGHLVGFTLDHGIASMRKIKVIVAMRCTACSNSVTRWGLMPIPC